MRLRGKGIPNNFISYFGKAAVIVMAVFLCFYMNIISVFAEEDCAPIAEVSNSENVEVNDDSSDNKDSFDGENSIESSDISSDDFYNENANSSSEVFMDSQEALNNNFVDNLGTINSEIVIEEKVDYDKASNVNSVDNAIETQEEKINVDIANTENAAVENVTEKANQDLTNSNMEKTVFDDEIDMFVDNNALSTISNNSVSSNILAEDSIEMFVSDNEIDSLSDNSVSDNSISENSVSENQVKFNLFELPDLSKYKKSPFDFIMDPQQLINATNGARYGGKSFKKGSTLFFKNTNGDYDYSDASDMLEILNKGNTELTITVIARFTGSGHFKLSSNPFFNSNDEYLYIALVDSEGNCIPINEYGFAINTITLQPGEEDEITSYMFGLTGKCNEQANWRKVMNCTAELEVFYFVEGEDLSDEDELGDQIQDLIDSISDNSLSSNSISENNAVAEKSNEELANNTDDVNASVSDNSISSNSVSDNAISSSFVDINSVSDNGAELGVSDNAATDMNAQDISVSDNVVSNNDAAGDDQADYAIIQSEGAIVDENCWSDLDNAVVEAVSDTELNDDLVFNEIANDNSSNDNNDNVDNTYTENDDCDSDVSDTDVICLDDLGSEVDASYEM